MNLVEILNTDDVSPYRSAMSSPTAANGRCGHGRCSMNRSSLPTRVLCSDTKYDRSVERGNWVPPQFTAVNTTSSSNSRGHAASFSITSPLSKNYKRSHHHHLYTSSYSTPTHSYNSSPGHHHQIFSSSLSRSSFIMSTDLSSGPQAADSTSQQMAAHERQNSTSSTISGETERLPNLQTLINSQLDDGAKKLSVRLKTESDQSDLEAEDNGAHEQGSPPTPATPTNMQTAHKCAFLPECSLPSPDRRVVSHYFGRNKKETRAMPDFVWVVYCRQHYQRQKYRSRGGEFAATQMDLVRKTVINLQTWGGVTGFDLALRKRATDQIAKEDSHARMAEEARITLRTPPPPYANPICRERVLLPYVGKNKSFTEIFDFIDMVSKKCTDEGVDALEFEIIPIFKPGHITKKTPTRRTPAKRTATSPLPGSSSPTIRRR